MFFGYDGYYGKKFIAKHTVNGKPDSALVFNRESPPYLFAAAVTVAVYAWIVRNKKIIADDQQLIISEKEKIRCRKNHGGNFTKRLGVVWAAVPFASFHMSDRFSPAVIWKLIAAMFKNKASGGYGKTPKFFAICAI